jgi:peptidoglycan/LPS O-acetylase OafA/YrhL
MLFFILSGFLMSYLYMNKEFTDHSLKSLAKS